MVKNVLSILLATLFIQTAQAKVEDIDRVVAVVNANVITLSELDFRVKEFKRENAGAEKQMPLEKLRGQVLDQMIAENVLIQYAKDTGLSAAEEEIDQFILVMAKEQKQSIEGFYAQAKKQGLSSSKLREELANQISVDKLKQREIFSRVTVAESEIDQEMGSTQTALKNQQVRLTGILIGLKDGSETEQRNKYQEAQKALGELARGTDFAMVAKKYSDLSNKNNGGDMGYKSLTDLPAELVTQVSRLNVGQNTSIIPTQEGFYIFQLVDRKGSAQQNSVHLVKNYRVNHILIKINDLTSESQALTRINNIKQQLQAGANFETLAKQYSEDGSAIQGGSLNWVTAEEVVPEFEQAMVQLPINQVSEPVRTPFGYHLIKVIEIKEKNVAEDQKREKIKQQIINRKAQQVYVEWVDQVIAGAHVVNKLNEDE